MTMSDQAVALRAPQFTIGNVISTTFSVLARNFVPFLLIAIVIAIPYFLVTYIASGTPPLNQSQVSQGHVFYSYFARVSSVSYWLSIIPQRLTLSLVAAALAYGTFQDLRGVKKTAGELAKHGLGSLVPVALAAMVYSILLTIGVLLLVVPGVILAIALWVYVPAIVIEKAGVGGSFRRSRELTKGYWWPIFALNLIAFAIVIGLEVVESIALRMPISVLVHHWAIFPLQVVYMIVAAVMSAVGYYYLRAHKEGVAIDEIAKVFD